MSFPSLLLLSKLDKEEAVRNTKEGTGFAGRQFVSLLLQHQLCVLGKLLNFTKPQNTINKMGVIRPTSYCFSKGK